MVAMRDIDDLLPEVLLYAPNCPEPVAVRFLRDAAREFCERTRCWRETVTEAVTTPESHAFAAIADADIVAIEAAHLGDKELTPRDVAWLDQNHAGWNTDADEGSASFITQLEENTVSIYPREEGDLTARLVLQPSATTTEVPAILVTKHFLTIGRGASGQILTIPNTEYANPQLGAAHLAEFRSLLNTAAIRARKGQQGAPLRTKPSWI